MRQYFKKVSSHGLRHATAQLKISMARTLKKQDCLENKSNKHKLSIKKQVNENCVQNEYVWNRTIHQRHYHVLSNVTD